MLIVVVHDVCPSVRPSFHLSVCPSFVEIISFCGNWISKRQVILKFDLNVDYGYLTMMNVRDNRFFRKLLFGSCKFMQAVSLARGTRDS